MEDKGLAKISLAEGPTPNAEPSTGRYPAKPRGRVGHSAEMEDEKLIQILEKGLSGKEASLPAEVGEAVLKTIGLLSVLEDLGELFFSIPLKVALDLYDYLSDGET